MQQISLRHRGTAAPHLTSHPPPPNRQVKEMCALVNFRRTFGEPDGLPTPRSPESYHNLSGSGGAGAGAGAISSGGGAPKTETMTEGWTKQRERQVARYERRGRVPPKERVADAGSAGTGSDRNANSRSRSRSQDTSRKSDSSVGIAGAIQKLEEQQRGAPHKGSSSGNDINGSGGGSGRPAKSGRSLTNATNGPLTRPRNAAWATGSDRSRYVTREGWVRCHPQSHARNFRTPSLLAHTQVSVACIDRFAQPPRPTLALPKSHAPRTKAAAAAATATATAVGAAAVHRPLDALALALELAAS